MTSTGRKNTDVGYGKPPKKHQYGPGQSGNPKGRPPRSRNAAKLIHDKLFEVVTLNQNGKRVRMTYLEVIIIRLRQKAVEGDPKAVDQLIRLMPLMEHNLATLQHDTGRAPALQEEDLRILKDFLENYGPKNKDAP